MKFLSVIYPDEQQLVQSHNADFTKDASTLEEALKLDDHALSRTKESDRNQVIVSPLKLSICLTLFDRGSHG